MDPAVANPVVHLELHTGNLPRACAFYTRLLGWSAETVHVGTGSYLTLGLGDGLEGGVVETEAPGSLWLPYARVEDVTETTARSRALGAAVILEPREGPAGWRSVIAEPDGAQIALWQPKT